MKESDEFGKNKANSDGLAAYCKPCKKAVDSRFYDDNKESILQSASRYRTKNHDTIKVKKKVEYVKNKESYLLRASNRYYQNRDSILAASKASRIKDSDGFYKKAWKRKKARREKNPSIRAIDNVRARVASFMNGKSKVSKKLGCSVEQLKAHLESQFQPGMSWDNYGEWHIDHKYPLSIAYEKGPETFAEACHYTNLQPLWAQDNFKKSNKV